MAQLMYLIDTNVVSELRKGNSTNRGVIEFLYGANAKNQRCYLSVITVGEIRRGIKMIRHRGDLKQAASMSDWLSMILLEYHDHILPIDQDVASVWADLRVPNYENALDKLVAATALLHSLQVVTRNVKGFDKTGVKTLNPFVV